MTHYILEIKPAIEPSRRHKIHDLLTSMGYNVVGGGTHLDMSACDISFDDGESEDASRESIPTAARSD